MTRRPTQSKYRKQTNRPRLKHESMERHSQQTLTKKLQQHQTALSTLWALGKVSSRNPSFPAFCLGF